MCQHVQIAADTMQCLLAGVQQQLNCSVVSQSGLDVLAHMHTAHALPNRLQAGAVASKLAHTLPGCCEARGIHLIIQAGSQELESYNMFPLASL